MESLDVQDPSDFPIDTLRKLDSSLRCPICKELFDGPVVLHCGHTFCSLCVRTLLPAKPECPQCRSPAKELHIVRNVTFEEAVMAWSDARATVLQLARESVRSHLSSSGTFSRSVKRKKLQAESGTEAGPSKLLRSGSDKSRSPPFEQEDDDRSRCSTDDELAPAAQGPTVPCPLCERDVAFHVINQHIDSACKKFVPNSLDDSHERKEVDATSKAAWESIFNGQGKKAWSNAKNSEIPLRKLAKVSYGTMKVNDIRKLLSDRGLPTSGERQELIQRHQIWIAIYNANLDRGQPKGVAVLKRQLKEMEMAASHPGTKRVQDDEEHARKHSAQFASLIDKARPKGKATGDSISVVQSSVSQRPSQALSPNNPQSSDVIVID